MKIIFQPAEESSLGALMILKTDVMHDVDFAWGFHADPTNDVRVSHIPMHMKVLSPPESEAHRYHNGVFAPGLLSLL